MRITFVLPGPDLSGGVRVVAIYADALTRKGHAVTVVSPPPRTPTMGERLKSVLSRQARPPESANHASHLDDVRINHVVLDRRGPVLDRDIPDGDVVIATWWETAEWVSALNEKKGAKVYFIQHHEVFPYLPVERSHATYRLPMHKIVVAKWLRETMNRYYGDSDVDVVPNAVDKSQFHAAARGKQSIPTVGFLYSTTPFKGVDVLFSALHIVRTGTPSVRLLSFGSERPGSRLPLPPGTDYVFRPAQNSLRSLYSQCDAWLTASKSEGFNLPALEAMACRTPVIATRTGWPAEALSPWRNGVLVDIDDVESLASTTMKLLSLTDNEWRLLSEGAYQTASKLSWADSADRFERALVRACSRAAAGDIAGKPTTA